jgi:hypothetical protein
MADDTATAFVHFCRRSLEADPQLCPVPDARMMGACLAWLLGMAAAFEATQLAVIAAGEDAHAAIREEFTAGLRDAIRGQPVGTTADAGNGG